MTRCSWSAPAHYNVHSFIFFLFVCFAADAALRRALSEETSCGSVVQGRNVLQRPRQHRLYEDICRLLYLHRPQLLPKFIRLSAQV